MHVYLRCVLVLLLIHHKGEGEEDGSHRAYCEARWWGQRVAVVREHHGRRGGPGADDATAVVVVGSAYAPLSGQGRAE